jgi:hypothetical protein
MSTIRNQAMLVSLHIGLFNPKKTDRNVTREVLISKNANSNAGAFVKNILPEESVKPIQSAASALRTWVNQQTLPWGDDAVRLLPVAQWEKFTDELRARITSLQSLFDQFMADYEKHRDTAILQLGALANRADYPSASEVRTKFYVDVSYMPMPDSRDFRLDDMPEEAMSELRAQADLRVAEAVNDARNDLYRRLTERLDHIVKRMTEVSAKKEGNRIHASLLTNLAELCQLIPSLNVTKDQELENLRQRVLRDITPFDIEDVRENEAVREDLKSKAAGILAAMGFNQPITQQREAA